MSSRKRLTWRTLREAPTGLLVRIELLEHHHRTYTSCSSKRKIAVGSCISTLVSSTNSRPVRERASFPVTRPKRRGPVHKRRAASRLPRMTGTLTLRHACRRRPLPSSRKVLRSTPRYFLRTGFRFDDIEESADGLIRIREQREGSIPGRELVVRGDAVARDADTAPRLGVRSCRSRKSRLRECTRRSCPAVEVDHQALARRLLQAPGAAAVMGREKSGTWSGFDRGHLFSGLDRLEDGVEVERIAEFHEFFPQVRHVDAARHVDDHLHREHGGAGMRGRVAAGRDFGDVIRAWRRNREPETMPL